VADQEVPLRAGPRLPPGDIAGPVPALVLRPRPRPERAEGPAGPTWTRARSRTRAIWVAFPGFPRRVV
jgi:hypothetical protein